MIKQFHFDMMNKEGEIEPAVLYREALAIAEYVDQGTDLHAAVLSEHHMAPYMTDPIGFGFAMAARTKECRVRLQSVVAPNYDPVRLAEQTAQLDIVSNGRLDLTLAWGYDPAERAMYPRNLKAPEFMGKLIPMLRAAWAGEEFSWDGRAGVLEQLPVQDRIPIFIAGVSEAAIKRAAALGDGFMATMEASVPQYLAECEALGKEPGEIRFPTPYKNFFVSNDPEETWQRVRPFAQHDADVYWQWTAHFQVPKQTVPATLEECRASGEFMIVTPDEAIDYLKQSDVLYCKPLMGGLDPDVAWESARLLVEQVFPALDS
ncbi:MAG: LLM class flavin-dependent oxidoreductase [Deltaproteobacteria bacterium]|nr:LLM class flavin-dependent oxidoreductase [Deltaproteobacteria bacterium]